MGTRARHPATCKWFRAVRIDIYGVIFFLIYALEGFLSATAVFTFYRSWQVTVGHGRPEPGLQVREYSFTYCR